MKLSTHERKLIKIKVSAHEVAHAELLPGNLGIVSNIPFDDVDLNLDDVVELGDDEDGIMRVIKIISRRYDVKATLRYDEEWQYFKLCDLMADIGGKSEGGIGPSADGKRRGVMVVACCSPTDPIGLAESVGIKQDLPEALAG